MLGTLAAGGGAAWPAPSCAGAHRSRAAAAAPMAPHLAAAHPAVTRRGLCAPRVGRAVVMRRVRQPPDERPQHRAGTPRIVRAGPSSVKTSDAVKLSSGLPEFVGRAGECDVLVVVLAGGQAAVQTAEEPSEQVALGGGVPVAVVAAAVVVGAGAG